MASLFLVNLVRSLFLGIAWSILAAAFDLRTRSGAVVDSERLLETQLEGLNISDPKQVQQLIDLSGRVTPVTRELKARWRGSLNSEALRGPRDVLARAQVQTCTATVTVQGTRTIGKNWVYCTDSFCCKVPETIQCCATGQTCGNQGCYYLTTTSTYTFTSITSPTSTYTSSSTTRRTSWSIVKQTSISWLTDTSLATATDMRTTFITVTDPPRLAVKRDAEIETMPCITAADHPIAESPSEVKVYTIHPSPRLDALASALSSRGLSIVRRITVTVSRSYTTTITNWQYTTFWYVVTDYTTLPSTTVETVTSTTYLKAVTTTTMTRTSTTRIAAVTSQGGASRTQGQDTQAPTATGQDNPMATATAQGTGGTTAEDSPSNSRRVAAIAGGTVGAISGLAILAGLFYFIPKCFPGSHGAENATMTGGASAAGGAAGAGLGFGEPKPPGAPTVTPSLLSGPADGAPSDWHSTAPPESNYPASGSGNLESSTLLNHGYAGPHHGLSPMSEVMQQQPLLDHQFPPSDPGGGSWSGPSGDGGISPQADGLGNVPPAWDVQSFLPGSIGVPPPTGSTGVSPLLGAGTAFVPMIPPAFTRGAPPTTDHSNGGSVQPMVPPSYPRDAPPTSPDCSNGQSIQQAIPPASPRDGRPISPDYSNGQSIQQAIPPAFPRDAPPISSNHSTDPSVQQMIPPAVPHGDQPTPSNGLHTGMPSFPPFIPPGAPADRRPRHRRWSADFLVVVTSANGFLASHVVDQLLLAGYPVRGTVRSISRAAWIQTYFNNKYGKNKLSLIEVPDISAPNALDKAIKGAYGIVHTGSPVIQSFDPNLAIPTAVEGTLNAMRAAAKESSVKRVILTSSYTAAADPQPNKQFMIDSGTWNEDAVHAAWAPPPYEGIQRKLNVYSASKTQAEQAAWQFMHDERPPFVLNTVVPSANIGPVLSLENQMPPNTTGWIRALWNGFRGSEELMAKPPQYYVSVLDTARVHVAALIFEDVEGERLFAFARPYNWNDVLAVFRRLYPVYANAFMTDIPGLGRDLSVVANQRAEELLKRLGLPGWASLEESVWAVTETFV